MCSLKLLECLNSTPAEIIQEWFTINFFLGDEEPSIEACESICSKNLTEFIVEEEFYYDSLRLYDSFMVSRSRRKFNVNKGMPASILSDLDGVYWTLYE